MTVACGSVTMLVKRPGPTTAAGPDRRMESSATVAKIEPREGDQAGRARRHGVQAFPRGAGDIVDDHRCGPRCIAIGGAEHDDIPVGPATLTADDRGHQEGASRAGNARRCMPSETIPVPGNVTGAPNVAPSSMDRATAIRLSRPNPTYTSSLTTAHWACTPGNVMGPSRQSAAKAGWTALGQFLGCRSITFVATAR